MALQNRRKLKFRLTTAACILILCLVQVKAQDSSGDTVKQIAKTEQSESSGIKKKELKNNMPAPVPDVEEVAKVPANSTAVHTKILKQQENEGVKGEIQKKERVVVISEKSLFELQADAEKKKETHSSAATAAGALPKDLNAFVQTQISMNDSEIPNSFQNGFILLLGLSTAFTIFIALRIYKLRLSRAERKYGVQGDRSAQELTPLPIAIEDCSDDDDQTLFDIQRQQIRIL